ncbi:unnamed protein product [Linum trigynum]|uniref:Reverse transcriptase domain-containing protein n=1 Tax=Linum trigynum TaxID=586398 RepID=A0AAV2G085_9ROSI
MEEISWRQKARDFWFQVGDKNSAYFHRVANYNQRKKLIQVLKVDGQVLVDKVDIKNAFITHFQQRFTEPLVNRPFPVDFKKDLFSLDDNFQLTLPFSELEVWDAVNSCGNNKAHGPDGFTIEFFKKAWSIVKNDLVKAVDEFYITGFVPDSIGHSFLCLIPKKESAEGLNDFRPISLVGSLNKIISKLLFRRLRPFMSKAISPQQFAGIKGRQIHEAGLIANELVDSIRRSGRPGLILKLDIEKAFDSVSWGCLLRILQNMGLHT